MKRRKRQWKQRKPSMLAVWDLSLTEYTYYRWPVSHYYHAPSGASSRSMKPEKPRPRPNDHLTVGRGNGGTWTCPGPLEVLGLAEDGDREAGLV